MGRGGVLLEHMANGDGVGRPLATFPLFLLYSALPIFNVVHLKPTVTTNGCNNSNGRVHHKADGDPQRVVTIPISSATSTITEYKTALPLHTVVHLKTGKH